MCETWLKRSYRVVGTLLLMLAVYFQARGVAQLVVAASWRALRARALTKSLAPRPTPAKATRAVAERNAFDSATAPLAERRGAPLPTPVKDAADPLSWPSCAGVRVLIVTESMTDRFWSMTTLMADGEGGARLRRVGDNVAGKQVAFIGYNPRQQVPAVWLAGGDGACQAALFDGAPARPSPATERVARVSRAAPDFAAKIARLGDNALRVDRSLVDMTLRDPSALMQSVRIMPDSQSGEILGLRLAGIRPGSLLEALGLKNGDRLETVNGFAIGRPEKALEAYARLSTASALKVRLNRGGRPLELDLSID